MVWNSESTFHNLFLQVLIISSFEWETPIQHCIQQYPTRLNIYRRTTLLFLEHYFWCHITWGAAEDAHFLVVGDAGRKAEVDQLDVVFVV